MDRPIHHALVLNLHQPPGNLDGLLENAAWEAKEILFALDRIPRALWDFEDIGRVHLAMSGTLLESLGDPAFQERVYGIVDCGKLLWHFQNTQIIQPLGTGYYHPVLPLIPSEDWEEQLTRWQGIGGHLFWRENFSGFWPPEMGFTMELIPLLVKLGYRYVIIDCEHIEPIDELSWAEIRYQPHLAQYQGQQIIVIPRDRTLSDAQESGMDFGWFQHECHERTKFLDREPLVTTATDGDNGGWFRNTNPKGNFWYVFYQSFLEHVRRGWTVVRPTFIDDYLANHPVTSRVKVRTAAWNTGWHHGEGFVQWTGSKRQKEALARVKQVSRRMHELEPEATLPHTAHHLREAQWRVLRAETSCNFYWGEAWVRKCHEDLDLAEEHLARISPGA